MNKRKVNLKSKNAKSKAAKPAVRKKACRPPKSNQDLGDVDYNPNGNPTILSPYMQKLVEMITGRVIMELTKLLEEGKIKIPEKKISFTIRRNDYRVEPLPSSVVRRYLKQENSQVKKPHSKTKPPKKK